MVSNVKYFGLLSFLFIFVCSLHVPANGSRAGVGVGAGLGGFAVGTLVGSSISRNESRRSQDREVALLEDENEALQRELAARRQQRFARTGTEMQDNDEEISDEDVEAY